MTELASARVELRPLGLGELLDRTFTLYRSYFWLFCGVMVVPIVLRTLANVFTSKRLLSLPIFNATNPPANIDPRQFFSGFGAVLGQSMLFGLLAAFVYSFALAATVFCVANVYQRRAVSIRSVYRGVLSRFGRITGLFLLLLLIALAMYIVVAVIAGIGIAVSAGGLAAISPALGITFAVVFVLGAIALFLWFMMRFSLALPVMLVEERGPVDSLARSGALTSGSRGRIFVSILVMMAIAIGIGFIFTVIGYIGAGVVGLAAGAKTGHMPLASLILMSVSAGLGDVITGPFMAITLAVLYFDLRIRKEGFDLEMLMSAPVPEVSAVPPPAPLAP